MSEANTVLKYEGKFSTGGFQSTKWKTVTAHFMQEGTGRWTTGFTLHVKPTSSSMKRDQADLGIQMHLNSHHQNCITSKSNTRENPNTNHFGRKEEAKTRSS